MSARFLGDFGRMEAYQLVGGRLYIRLADNGGVYEFAPSTPDADLTGSGEPVVFRCVDSAGARVRLQVVFNKVKPASVTLMHKGKKATLPQVMSGSGARYEGPAGMFWNKGRAATVTWQGMQLTCTTMQE
jgi:membrane-bound inhibitor of C-type lysozyme